MSNTEQKSHHRQCMQEVDWQIRSNRPLIYICTHEEERVWDALTRICERKSKELWTLYGWDITGTIISNKPDAFLPQNGEAANQLSVLSWFDGMQDGLDDESDKGYSILVLKDFQKFFENGENSATFAFFLLEISLPCTFFSSTLSLMRNPAVVRSETSSQQVP